MDWERYLERESLERHAFSLGMVELELLVRQEQYMRVHVRVHVRLRVCLPYQACAPITG